MEEGNPIRIATAARRLERGTPAHGGGGGNRYDFAPEGEEDAEEDEEDRKERILRQDVKGMTLDMFQAKYTSEDNESFNALLDEQNAKQREKFAWKFNGNKKSTKQQFAIEQKKILLLADGTAPEDIKVTGERTEEQDVWSKEIETWKWNPMNVLMNPHPGLEEQIDPSQGQKLIHHTNTRIPTSPRPTGKTPAPSPSMSTVADAIAGRPSRTDTPKVNGYSFVSTPKPADLGAPKMTWGSLVSIPSSSTDPKPSPFRLPEVPAREKLARKLADKAQKDITARQRAYTPSLRRTTATLPSGGAGGKTPLAGTVGREVPKFASSPDVRKNMLTPAGQRLLEQSAQGRRGSSRLARQRETAEGFVGGSGAAMGRTPLMRTPLVRDGRTPLIRK